MSKAGIKTVIAELKKIGLDDHAIAGVLGNLEAESGWRPEVVNGSGHTGLAQWDTSRFGRLKQMAKKNGWGSPTGWEAQAKYLAYEIKSGAGGTSVKALNNAGNAGEAARVFEQQFERSGGSNMSGRITNAQKFAGSNILKNTTGEAPVAKVPGSDNGRITWVPKVGKNVTQQFGVANSRYAAGRHTGTDIGGGTGGQPIRWAPPGSGKVVKSGTDGAYGNHMIIEDEKGRQWLLAHMSSAPLKKGTQVSQGDKIGNVGSTGNSDGAHLHIEMTAPGEKWSYNNVKKPKLVFKVGTDGQVYDKDFKPVAGDFLDVVGLSGQALDRPGNEELDQLIQDAMDNDWTTQEFTRQFKASKWYQDRAASQRQFDMLQDTDQQQQIKQRVAEARRAAAEMGVTLTKEETRKLAVRIARDGYNPEQVRWFIGRRYSGQGDQSGDALTVQQALKEKARDYGVRIDASTMNKWTRDALQSGGGADSYEDNIREIAAQQNPYLREAYDRGLTTREALQSYIGSAAELMGVSENEIDLSDSKWRRTFDANGNALSDQQWRQQIKADASYGYGNTRNAVNEARMHGRNLMRSMGVFSG